MNILQNDTFYRQFSLVMALVGSVLLVYINWGRFKQLSKGEVVVREGLFALLISVVYSQAEQLFPGLPHWRLYILSLATFFVAFGLGWMAVERIMDKRDTLAADADQTTD